MSSSLFHPITWQWFQQQFGSPTEPQRRGWPAIAAWEHTLIAAPTGSGKTLSAFLVCIDRLLRDGLDDRLSDEIQVLYVSPLKALSNDIHRNLELPLAGIREQAVQAGIELPDIRTAVRTGDTPASERQKMLRKPPHILVTTPESLYLLLTAEKSRERLRQVRTVIVDEIHALARDKRGSHLALSLERLERLCERPLVRIGLSATQKPIDDIARFLVGSRHVDDRGEPSCQVIDVGHARELDVSLEVPPSDLAAVCSHEQWDEIYGRLTQLIEQHRSTLIFVNTRRLAERIAHRLTEQLGEEAVASHHGSLSKRLRQSAEQRLKAGQLRAIVATASLELGIDIGYIDLVCQIGSPRSIATFLQRVGRSGHSLGLVPRGRLFPLTRDELIECLALVRCVRRGELDRIEIPVAPLDILAQQMIAEVASQDWDERELFELCRRAWPYRDLSMADFADVVRLITEGVAPNLKRGAHLHRDAIHGRLRARRGARIAATTSGGAIPETAEYRVVTEGDQTFVGTLDEDFAIESQAGDVFLLGNTSWRIRFVRGGQVVVSDAQGAPPTVPFWFGEAPGRTVELSGAVSELRADLSERMEQQAEQDLLDWLIDDCGGTRRAAEQSVAYVRAGQAALGVVPTANQIVFERFFDESGGMQLVIHSPLGARINRAWGLALRKRFCRSFDFELQASADDDGIVLSLSPQHSFPVESLFKMIGPHNARDLLEQALLAMPMFQVRWRWNVTRALAVMRMRSGKKVPPYLQRFQADDLLASCFPEQVGCLENHHGAVAIPDHPLVRQTMHDCLHEATDVDGWCALLERVSTGEVQLIARETREPSPFSHELLNANPYAFLDPAPLEERRTRAVSARRTLSVAEMQDMGRLDPAAIGHVRSEAWPLVRDAEELHDALMGMVLLPEADAGDWAQFFQQLVSDGRAAVAIIGPQVRAWIAAERLPLVRAIFPESRIEPQLQLPAELQCSWERTAALVELVRGQISVLGPVHTAGLAKRLQLEVGKTGAALEALEADGTLLRGSFVGAPSAVTERDSSDVGGVEWCDRRLLARIHRLTLDGLRRQIQPVEIADYLRFLVRHQGLLRDGNWGGAVAVREALAGLVGFEMPAGAWERYVLPARVEDYESTWLDSLFQAGEFVWGRLRPPSRKADGGPSMAQLTRSVPLALLPRAELAQLLFAAFPDGPPRLRANASVAYEVLSERGALFFQELQTLTGLLPSHLEAALRELAAVGLVTADGFAAVRSFVDATRGGRRHGRRGAATRRSASAAGRWSVFPGAIPAADRDSCVDRWCHVLLRRWGVVFRDLLVRETAAPPWHELVRRFRGMERRGELRGGRFVAGVAGEQFANESVVERLRSLRGSDEADPWLVISAADPLNLTGVLTAAPRVPAVPTNSLILENGHFVAARQGRLVDCFRPVEQLEEAAWRRALRTGRRESEKPAGAAPQPARETAAIQDKSQSRMF